MFSRASQILREVRRSKVDILLIRKIFKHLRGAILPQLLGHFVPFEPILRSLSLKPLQLSFEVTNICTANCIFCAYQHIKRPKGTMKMEVFKKAINDFVSIGGGKIGLTPIVGEPLVDPGLIEKICYARSFKDISEIGIYTNGILLHKIGFRELLTSGVTSITISMGGPDRETYKRLYRVDSFDRVVSNIISLCEVNNELGQPARISVIIRSDRHLRSSDSLELKKMADMGIDMTYSFRYDNWAGRIAADDLLNGMIFKKPGSISEPCSMFYAGGPTVMWNGDVTVCGCRDIEGELVLGNIMEEDLVSLWQGNKMRELRQRFPENIPEICRDCFHYNSFKILRTPHLYKVARDNRKTFLESDYCKSHDCLEQVKG